MIIKQVLERCMHRRQPVSQLAPLALLAICTHLYARLRQLDAGRQLLAREHIRIVGVAEGGLQSVQLVGAEGGAIASLFPAQHHYAVVVQTMLVLVLLLWL